MKSFLVQGYTGMSENKRNNEDRLHSKGEKNKKKIYINNETRKNLNCFNIQNEETKGIKQKKQQNID